VIVSAREEAEALLAEDPDLSEHPGLNAEITRLLADDCAEYLEKT